MCLHGKGVKDKAFVVFVYCGVSVCVCVYVCMCIICGK